MQQAIFYSKNSRILILDTIDGAASIEEVAALLNALEAIDAVYADGGIDLKIASTGSLELLSEDFSVGGAIGGGVGLQIAGDVAAELNANLNIGVRITETDVVIADSTAPELEIGIDVDVSLVDTGGSLGFLDLKVNDSDPDTPEVHVGASIDIASGSVSTLATQNWAPDFTGTAALNLKVDVIPKEFLPALTMNLVMTYDMVGTAPPTIAFNDISIDPASLFGIFAEVIGDLAELLDTEPLGTILDIMTGPIPLIDDLAHALPGGVPDSLDQIPSILPDDIVSLLDLAAAKSGLEGNDVNHLFDVIGTLGMYRQIGQQIGSGE